MTSTEVLQSRARAQSYRGNDRLVLGIVLAVITFWLFAQTTLNVAPVIRDDLRISTATSDLGVSITALFSGIFIIVAGDLADRFGRVKLTYVASGIYKMASSLGAALGVAISAAIFTGVSRIEGIAPMATIALGRTDNVSVRFAASMALAFNVLMVVIAVVAIMLTVPGEPTRTHGTPSTS